MGKVRAALLWLSCWGALLAGCGPDHARGPDVVASADTVAIADVATIDAPEAVADVSPPAPKLMLLPPLLDFGEVELGVAYTKQLRMCNVGDAPLLVTSIEASELQPGVTVEVEGVYPITINAPSIPGGCDTGKLVQVQLKATTPLTKGQPVGEVTFQANDPNAPELTVRVFATTDVPKLRVMPGKTLDFGSLGPGVQTHRTVELLNEGAADVEIHSVSISGELSGEFALEQAEWGPTQTPPLPIVLGSGQYASFQLTATAMGPPEQHATAKLTISSTDWLTPSWELALQAARTSTAVCAMALLPADLSFGLVPYGKQRALALSLQNVGSGACQFQSANIVACTAPNAGGQAETPLCSAANSSVFQVKAPPTSQAPLQPGDVTTFEVVFTAPQDIGAFAATGTIASLHGLLVAEFVDLASGATVLVPPVSLSDPASLTSAKANLHAEAGTVGLVALPSQLAFAPVTAGCQSPEREVRVWGTEAEASGTPDVVINKVALEGCSDQLVPQSWPTIPPGGLVVTPDEPVSLRVRYLPKNLGTRACKLVVWTSASGVCADDDGMQSGSVCSVNADCGAGEFCAGQQLIVPIVAQSTLGTVQTDTFTFAAPKRVDVLFVVDDAATMVEEQIKLSDGIYKFLQAAEAWKTDYHIGVITTDMTDVAKQGRLRASDGVRVVTPQTPDGLTVLRNLIQAGASGANPGQGLAAIEHAVAAPLTSDLGKACNVDSDCTSPAQCIPDADDPALKACGGANRTFLRPDASLHVVVLSDRDDNSPGAVDYYSSLFRSLHGPAAPPPFQLHAIIGPPWQGMGCVGPSGSAAAGSRYLAVAKGSDGFFDSICSSGFATMLQAIGGVVFGPSRMFSLSRVPEVSSLEVQVGGVVCESGYPDWYYDEALNSWYLPAVSDCVPKVGDKVEISYTTACFPW